MATSATQYDPKNLNAPGTFEGMIEGFMKNKLAVGAVLAIILAVGAGTAILGSRKDAQEQQAAVALFEANKTVESESQAIAKSIAPPAKEDAKVKSTAPKEPSAPKIEHMRMDVEARMPESMKKLTAVADQYKGSRSGFEARMTIADLYFDHGEPAKAVSHYEKAADQAPNKMGKAFAYSGLGYSLENTGKPAEALQAFEKALQQGVDEVKGDLLLAVARSHEALKDTAKARSTYDQILSQLPNTSYARNAEQLKAQLQ